MINKLRPALWPICGFILLLIAWQITAMILAKPYILPDIPAVIIALIGNYKLLLNHSLYTLAEALIGLGCAIILAFICGALLSYIKILHKMFYPLLLASQMIPIMVLAPLFTIWFGFYLLPKVLIVILICFFPILINILAGINSVDKETIAFYRSMGLNGFNLFKKIYWPFTLPYFFSGLRIAATYSMMGAVIGEWVGAANGLGLLLIRAQSTFNIALCFAVIVLIVFWTMLILLIIKSIEWQTLSWKHQINEDKWHN